MRFVTRAAEVLLLPTIVLLPPSCSQQGPTGAGSDPPGVSPYTGIWVIDSTDPEMQEPRTIHWVDEACSGDDCAQCIGNSGEILWYPVIGGMEPLFVERDGETLRSVTSDVAIPVNSAEVWYVRVRQHLEGTVQGNEVALTYVRLTESVFQTPPGGGETELEEWHVRGRFEWEPGSPVAYLEGELYDFHSEKSYEQKVPCLRVDVWYDATPMRLRLAIYPGVFPSETCLTGRVEDDWLGHPLEFAEVTAYDDTSGVAISQAYSDVNGEYCLSVPTGTTVQLEAIKSICGGDLVSPDRVTVRTPGYETSCHEGGCSQVSSITIPVHQTCIEGFVLGTAGQPLFPAYAGVFCENQRLQETTTTADGHYCLYVPESATVQVVARYLDQVTTVDIPSTLDYTATCGFSCLEQDLILDVAPGP